MHVRVSTFTGATDIDAGVAFVREKAFPALAGLKGFRGLTASADRSDGTLGVLALWETEEDMRASDAAAAQVRQEAGSVIGGEVTVQALEQVAADTADTPPAEGCALRVTRLTMDPAKVDENVAFYGSEVIPRLKARPGFRGVRAMMDRATGQGMVGTVWDDKSALEAADDTAAQVRQEAAARGVEFGDTSVREVLFTQMK